MESPSIMPNFRVFVPMLLGAIVFVVQGVVIAANSEPFSVVSMTLHDKALAGAHDVELSGNIAYVPGKRNSLSVIDISDPAKPVILWYLNDRSIPDSETVLPVGDRLFLGTKDFLSLDVSDPRAPVILKTVSDRPRIDKINGMIKVGDFILAANKSGYVDSFDVSDLSNPILFGAFETKENFGLSLPHDIDRYGDYIVIVDPNGFAPPVGKLGLIRAMKNGKVLPLDKWKLIGRIEGKELIGANRVQVKGDFAFVAGSYTLGMQKEAGVDFSHMAVVDISEPSKPVIVAECPFRDDRGPNGLTIAGNIVFCAGGQTVAAYDISNPTKPKALANQSFPVYKEFIRTDNYHDLIYRDGYLYVSAQSDDGFLILKVKDRKIRRLADEG